MRRWVGVWAALCVGSVSPAWAWDGPWRIASEGELQTRLELNVGTILPVTVSPQKANALTGMLRGAFIYLDRNTSAVVDVGGAELQVTYREQRRRYDVGAMPSFSVFGFTYQRRVLPAFHLLTGATLLASGARYHAASAGLCFQLGWALPLWGRNAETMHEYFRSYVQLETIPLAGSLLSQLMTEGFFDREAIQQQVYGEVGLHARLEGRTSAVEGDVRLSASYVHQHSLYLFARVRWQGPTLARRLAPVLESQYTAPLRPFRHHLSEEARALFYRHHLSLTVGLVFWL